MREIYDLVEISKYAGERFDLVQAGGGNTSVKYDNGEMIIKASGFLLSDVNEKNGYSKVNTLKVLSIVDNPIIIKDQNKRDRENITSQLVNEATIDKENRPSIETLLHSFLYKYTLHTHPIVVNMILVKKDFKNILNTLFQSESIAIVEYKTPGIELALALKYELSKFGSIPKIIFLQNHGLIVTSTHKIEIKQITENIIEKIERYLHLDMNRYKKTNEISYLLNSIEKNLNISYLSDDMYLNKLLIKNKELFFYIPFCPDSLVYCGISSCEIENLFDIDEILSYKKKYFELPKVIIYKDKLFFIASNVKKAKEMEEVFKFHIMVLEQNVTSKKNFLDHDELAYLSNWEAEQYRQKL